MEKGADVRCCRRTEEREKQEVRDTVTWRPREQESISLLESSQASPARPSDRNNMHKVQICKPER